MATRDGSRSASKRSRTKTQSQEQPPEQPEQPEHAVKHIDGEPMRGARRRTASSEPAASASHATHSPAETAASQPPRPRRSTSPRSRRATPVTTKAPSLPSAPDPHETPTPPAHTPEEPLVEPAETLAPEYEHTPATSPESSVNIAAQPEIETEPLPLPDVAAASEVAAASDEALESLALDGVPSPETIALELPAPETTTDLIGELYVPEVIADLEKETLEEPAMPQSQKLTRERHRATHGNALGHLIEQRFSDPTSPCRSYSDLERRSGISREALSRYVTARRDRRRSPTIDTLVAIADAMHISLEEICRAAAASVRGVILPARDEQTSREEILGSLVAALTNAQFNAVVELLRQIHPVHTEIATQ